MAAIGINLAIGLGASFLLSLFEPTQKIEGPKISDLSAPRSSYGSGIPIIWGRARVGGNLIWAVNLKEVVSRRRRRRGKGFGPKVQETTYSYFANFAVMICQGPIVRVNRVWLNGKLTYAYGGNGNDFFNSYARVYTGTSGQNPDPIFENTKPVVHNDYGLSDDPGARAAEIATIENTYGVNITNEQPGYRRRAYIVFENLPLADYNNAIPAVSAEIIAHENINLQQIIEELCAEAGMKPGEYDASALAGVPVTGFIIKNIQSINQALEQLQQAYLFDVIRSSGVLKFVLKDRSRAVVFPDPSLLASHPYGSDRPDDYTKEVLTIEQLSSEVNVTFLDPAEDYAENTASYRRQQLLPDNKKDISVQLALSIDQARQMAERLLYLEWIEQRIKYELAFPPALLEAEAGDLVQITVAGEVQNLEIRRVKLGANLICEYEAIPSDKSFLSYTRTLPVNPVESEILVEGETIAHILDMNLVADSDPEGLYYSATGEGTWRFGYLFASADTTNYDLINTIDTRGTIGTTEGALRDALSYVFDDISELIVELIGNSQLQSVPNSQLDLGRNKALVGDEILQFKESYYLGDRRWLLRGFRRGIRGTASKTTGHNTGELFLLLTGDDAFVQVQEGTTSDIGRTYYFKALNSSQTLDQVAAITVPVVGNPYRPYAPSGVTLTKLGNADLVISWQRHTRRNGRWRDGGDIAIPLEEQRGYVEILDGVTIVQSGFVSGNQFTYTAADQVSDWGATKNELTLRVWQVNDAVISGFKGYPWEGSVEVSRVIV